MRRQPPDGSAASNAVWGKACAGRLLEQKLELRATPSGYCLEGAQFRAADAEFAGPSLPPGGCLEKCFATRKPLAFRLKGAVLATEKRFPARALFPGWYGMDSVKWLRRTVVRTRSDGADFESSGMSKPTIAWSKDWVAGGRHPAHDVLVKSLRRLAGGSFKLLRPARDSRFRVEARASCAVATCSADAGGPGRRRVQAPPKRFTWGYAEVFVERRARR